VWLFASGPPDQHIVGMTLTAAFNQAVSRSPLGNATTELPCTFFSMQREKQVFLNDKIILLAFQ
jgi:hypothetical protein